MKIIKALEVLFELIFILAVVGGCSTLFVIAGYKSIYGRDCPAWTQYPPEQRCFTYNPGVGTKNNFVSLRFGQYEQVKVEPLLWPSQLLSKQKFLISGQDIQVVDEGGQSVDFQNKPLPPSPVVIRRTKENGYFTIASVSGEEFSISTTYVIRK